MRPDAVGHLAIRNLVVPVAAILLVSLVGWASPAAGGTYTQTLAFSERDLTCSRIGNYDLVALAGARWMDQPGAPRLPLVPVRIALPSGAANAAVSIVVGDSIVLPGTYAILAAEPPEPVGAVARGRPVEPDPEVYGSPEAYPRHAAVVAGMGTIAGSTICDLLVYPLRYSPSERKLMLYTQITLRLDFVDAAVAPGSAQEPVSPEAFSLVTRLVANQAEPYRWTSRLVGDRVPQGSGQVDYLIITSDSLRAAFEPLRQWKMRKGLVSEIVSIETITGAYPGADLAEKIRTCIRYFHCERGTEWVLLGGDVEIIPARKAYIPISDRPDVPCDLYYADLDGTWNDDGNLHWGEVPSDNVDMYADVFLGRAPVATADEAATFVNKVLTYEGCYQLPVDYQLRMAFLGEILWGDLQHPQDPEYTDGGVAKNLVQSRYVPARFSIDKLYESSHNLNRSTALSALNHGRGFINICCHGFFKEITVASDYLSDTDFAALASGNRYGLMYSTTCLSGGFDQSDCIGEAWVLAPQGGGFYIGNSRYGWDEPGYPGDGPSDLYDQEFFSSVFLTGFTNLGKAFADAKHEFVGESRSDPYMRYVMYDLNLLGDPELPLWTDTPEAITVTAPASLDTTPQVFAVNVMNGAAPLAGAKVCLWKEGEVYVVGETDGSGNASLAVDAMTPGTLLLTVTAPNMLPYLGQATVGVPHLAPPSELVAAEGTGPCVKLAWSKIIDGGLASYRIYRNTSAAPVLYHTVAAAETTFCDTAVAIGGTYYYWVSGLDSLGRESAYSDMAVVQVRGDGSVPDARGDHGVRVVVTPNPFRASTRLTVDIPHASGASVAVFDVRGRCVARPALERSHGSSWMAVWTGDDQAGGQVPPGVYFVTVTSDRLRETLKVVRLK